MTMQPALHSQALTRRRLLTGTAGAGLAAAAGAWLAGCTSATGDAGTPTPGGAGTVARLELGPESADRPPYPDDYVVPRARDYAPFSDGSKTFRVVVPQNTTTVGDWNTNKFSQWLEQRTGMKVKYDAVLVTGAAGGTDLTKINAMIAAGDLPDAFLGIPFTPAQISLYGQQGLFQPLGDLIETYAPEMRAVQERYPELKRELRSLDGKIYQFKSLSECYHCKVSPGRAWVHQDYLAAVGGAMPTTTEELRELLKLFQAKDPSKTGKMVPLAAGAKSNLAPYFMNSFLQTPATDWMRLNSGKVDFVADKPEWREGLRYLRTLFQDGTLTTSTLTATPEEVLAAGNQGRIGVARCYYQGIFTDLSDKPDDLWTRYVALPPVKGPNGVQFSCWSDNPFTGIPLLITNKCANPELMVQWGDRQMDLLPQCLSYGGVKGGNWDWASVGDKGITDKQAVWYAKKYPVPLGEGWDQLLVYNFTREWTEGQRSDPAKPNFEKYLHQATKPYEPFKPSRENQLPALIFDDASAAEQATRKAAIDPYVALSMSEFIIGKRDIGDDAAWNDYVSTLDKMGVKQQIELYQKMYEAQPK